MYMFQSISVALLEGSFTLTSLLDVTTLGFRVVSHDQHRNLTHQPHNLPPEIL
jgi:hypothetical protein